MAAGVEAYRLALTYREVLESQRALLEQELSEMDEAEATGVEVIGSQFAAEAESFYAHLLEDA